MVPQAGRDIRVRERARDELKAHDYNLGDFFTLGQIDGWQYPVAETLTTFMIRQSKSNYVDFINGMKDGLEWQEAIQTKYKAPLQRLVPIYGAWLGLKPVLKAPEISSSNQ